MCRPKETKNAKETPERTADGEERNNDVNEQEPESSGFWAYLLSFLWGSENAGHSRDATRAEDRPPTKTGLDPPAGQKKQDPASEEGTSDASQNQNDSFKSAEIPERESEGYGSMYMPCCPCSGHLDDQPCMPKWCFSYKYIDWLTIVALITCFCWGTLYSVAPSTVSPEGALFTLSAVTILTYAAGHASAYLIRLPPSLFMFVVGFAFRNSPVWDNTQHFADSQVEAAKAFILTIMSTKAALYFDGKIFLKYPWTILLLGIVPCIGEISTVGGVLYAISGLDLATAFTAATVLANVSSVVISHSLVTLAKAGYGAQTGIISILMAAAPIDGIIVLTLLGILVEGDEPGVAKAFITLGEQLIGILVGALVGALLAFVPSRNNVNATLQRTILHILSIMCVQLVSRTFGFQSVGHLFNTAAACATINCMSTKNWTIEAMMLKDTFEMIWHALQPVAVILVCCLVDFSELDPNMLWQSFVIFLVSYVMRCSLVLVSTQFSGKPIKQRILMSLCWTARGLTQGIMAGTLITFVSKSSSPQQTRDVITIFTVDLIAGNIIGSLQIWYLGPKLLPHNEPVSKV